jgi:hypothetical protein
MSDAKWRWLTRPVRRLSAWAWDDMLRDVSRVEWIYGRHDNGRLKDWSEWACIREHLLEAGRLRQPKELTRP